MNGKTLNEFKAAIETARLNAAARGEFRPKVVKEYFKGLNPQLWQLIAMELAEARLMEIIGQQPKIGFDEGNYSFEQWVPGYQGLLFLSIEGRAMPTLQLPPDQVIKRLQKKEKWASGHINRAEKDLKEVHETIEVARLALPYCAGDPKMTTAEGLEARQRYLVSEKAASRRRRAQKAGKTGGRGRT